MKFTSSARINHKPRSMSNAIKKISKTLSFKRKIGYNRGGIKNF